MKRALLFVGSLMCGPASAQNFLASLTFEASTDGGHNWQSGLVQLDPVPSTVQVRIRADWTPEAGYAFRSTRFDVVISDCGEGDSASTFARPEPFTAVTQTIVATRFGTVIKIDDARDTLPPSMWHYYAVIPAQHAEDFNPNFNSNRPVTIFTFDVHLDGTPGERSLDALVLRDTFNVPVTWIYRSARGEAVSMRTVVEPLIVRVVPAPGAFAMLASALLVSSRRRRVAR